MLTFESIGEVRRQVRAWRDEELTVGFVPTMGSLHPGHMSLLSAARFRADRVIASVFVNPLQFGPGEDFERYPRAPEEDARLLQDAGCEALFLPGVEEIYPKGNSGTTLVSVRPLSAILEGAHRPGHFDGVATVVAKLFGIVQPDIAVFGEKDYQQLAIVRRMAADLEIPVEIVGAPTVRSTDGLAMSSRNRYLSTDERARAPVIFATLKAAAERIHAGERNYTALSEWGAGELRAAQMEPDYFEVRDSLTLLAPSPDSRELVILTAARLGRARLIDNLRVAR
jgi:pantoate--beta-alanine ligase